MPGYTLKRIDEMEASFGGSYKRARAELGVTSFGMQVLDFPPNATRYPEHDHVFDGQEEVFVVLRGRGTIEVDGETMQLDPDVMIRVAPEAKRKLSTGDEPMRVLALSGVPGGVYEPAPDSVLGAPDPLAKPRA
ncbi:MAG TPA: cupin domain-containing protein [Thermoleophilaceae bacterium]|nr:cupin domain-containing protein [Thermoleophilaceae bacterium]